MARAKNLSPNAIDTKALFEAMEELEKTDGISKDFLIESIEQALVIAYKREYECQDENIKVVLGSDKAMHVYQEKTVVEEVENDKTEIALKDALDIDKNYKEGDIVLKEIMPMDFGRIAAQTARQVITQKIKEKTKDIVYEEFKDKEGEIVTGLVQKVTKNIILLDLGKTEAIMPKKEQIATETYKLNDKIRACILSVEKDTNNTTKIIVSRSSKEFIRKAMEIEIPEIYEGLIEIKSISRIPGERTKIAVYSPNPDIDPVGSCVGQKGIRIQNIINELNGEKFDIIEWDEDIATFIASSLLPATVLAVDVNEEERFAQVIVPDDQFSLAIGKNGHNVRLGVQLTEYKIDIKSESQIREIMLKQLEAENNENKEDNKEDVVENEENVEEKVEENIEENKEDVVEVEDTINNEEKTEE